MGGNLLIKGGQIIDGTGAPQIKADVRIKNGVIVEIGPDLSAGEEDIYDADGAFVSPGFIDSHTHTDATVFWNPALDPEPLHGVTTVLVGNCGLTLYPYNGDDKSRTDLCNLFSYLEDIPRDLFDSLPWTWTEYEGYRDAVNRQGSGANIAALVGHAPIRMAVMGEDAWIRQSTQNERIEMANLLDRSMRAGAFGMSVSFFDADEDGRPIPSRVTDLSEFDLLVDVVGRYQNGVVEFLFGSIHPNPEIPFEYLAQKCAEKSVPLMFNGFVDDQARPEYVAGLLELVHRLNQEGASVYPLLSPRSIDLRVNWNKSIMFMSMPHSWHQLIKASESDKRSLLIDPEWRALARKEWDPVKFEPLFPRHRPELVRFVDVVGEENKKWIGKTLHDLISSHEGHPSDIFADFVLANDCRPGVTVIGVQNGDANRLAELMKDPSVLISSSDAGAHVQMLCASGDTTLFLTRHVRDRKDFSIESAIHQLTVKQAMVLGIQNRGKIALGQIGDIVVFAIDELHYDDDVFANDLPGGNVRLRRPEGGYRATFVNGVAVQTNGKLTGALPGGVIACNN